MSNENEYRTGGIESKMDGVATFYLIVAIIALLACLAVGNSEANQKSGLSVFWFALAIVSIAQGVIAWVLFRAGAETIRLLKKLNGIPYGGEISQAKPLSLSPEQEYFECTDCKTRVAADAKQCPNCGAKFDN